MKKRLTAKQILLKAAQILKKHGWVQHTYESEGRFCLFGALQMAAYGSTGFTSTGPHRSYDAACADLYSHGYNLAWNDAPSRRRRAVIAALRKVARLRK